MRLLLEDIIAELQRLLHDTKSPRDRVLLESALSSLREYKKVNEKKPV
jgi:hypothetical protein